MVGGGWGGWRSLSCRQYSSVTTPHPTHTLTFQRLWNCQAPRTKPSVSRPPATPTQSSGPSVCLSLFLLWVIIGGCRTLLGRGAGMLSSHPFDSFLPHRGNGRRGGGPEPALLSMHAEGQLSSLLSAPSCLSIKSTCVSLQLPLEGKVWKTH